MNRLADQLGLGALTGGNVFLSQAHHTAYAVALHTLHDQYPAMAGVLAQTILSARAKVGETPATAAALPVVTRMAQLANQGRLLLNDARAKLSTQGRGTFAGGSRDPQVSQEDWDLAYTINLGAMEGLLRQLEPARVEAQRAADTVITDTLNRLGRSIPAVPPIPPAMDWAGPNVAEDFVETVSAGARRAQQAASAIGARVPWVLIGAAAAVLLMAKYGRPR